ncbi:6064_t:CDS:2, partial [Acaulospora colombiana]
SRNIHEQGKKHKENVEKFLRNIYRKEQEERKENDKIKRELKRIERDALKQYKKDLALEVPGANIATHQSNSRPTVTTQYPGESAAAGDAQIEESVIGEWRPVTPPPVSASAQKQDPFIKDEFKNDNSIPPLQDDDEFEDPDDLSNFKVVEKTLSIDEVAGENTVSFKKRKFGSGSNKTRNIRKRIA